MSASVKHQFLGINTITMHIADAGAGPLVVLCHGWPELGYSWRHQLSALADAGFRAVAPDMRGFGRTTAPEDIGAYSILHTVGDMVGLVAALGEKQAVIVGHDWGAPVAWYAAMMRPDIFRAVVGMSVPPPGRGPTPPVKTLREAGLTNFYWVYFQTPGIAEAEFERDPTITLRCILGGGAVPGENNKSPLMLEAGRGFLGDRVAPETLPPWLNEAELAQFVAEYTRTGFRGGLNWYRNIDRNWELTAVWQGAVIPQPALFIAGTKDPVISGEMGQRALQRMPAMLPNLKRTLLIEGAGHWVQQERPKEVNAALIDFLKSCA